MRALFCLLVLASAAQGDEGAIGSGVLPEIQAPSQLESPELTPGAANGNAAASIQRPLTQPVARTLGGSALGPDAHHHHPAGTTCSQCQGGGSQNQVRHYSHDGCRTNVCQQAAAAGYSLSCCDANMTPYFALWADYCHENEPAAPACGPAGCQTRNWGRGANACSSCGMSCKLAMLKAKVLSRPHLPNVWTRSVVSDGNCLSGDCQGEVMPGGYVSDGGVLDVAPGSPSPATTYNSVAPYSSVAPYTPAPPLKNNPQLPSAPAANSGPPAGPAPGLSPGLPATAPVGLPYGQLGRPPITPAPQTPAAEELPGQAAPAGAEGNADGGTPAAPDVDLLESSYHVPGAGRGQQQPYGQPLPYGWKPQAAQLPPAAPVGGGSGWNRFRGKY